MTNAHVDALRDAGGYCAWRCGVVREVVVSIGGKGWAVEPQRCATRQAAARAAQVSRPGAETPKSAARPWRPVVRPNISQHRIRAERFASFARSLRLALARRS